MLAFSRYLIKENTKQGIRETGGGGEGVIGPSQRVVLCSEFDFYPLKVKKKKAKEKSSQ